MFDEERILLADRQSQGFFDALLETLEGDDTPHNRQVEPVGRNEPCPCGSGKKYKKCCMKFE
jgi:uncharacterized protein YecA (UPF0149 family)